MPFKIDPELAAALAKLGGGADNPSPPKLGDVNARRAIIAPGIKALAGSNFPTDVKTKDYFTASSDGHEVLLRWYCIDDQLQKPAVIYIHGGGMILGSVDEYHVIVAGYVTRTRVPFLSVEYRLAPEFPYPMPLNDVYTAIAWLSREETQKSLNVDSRRIAIMGDSGGGGLAAAAALLARQKGGPQLAKMILLSPMLDDRTIQADEHISSLTSWTVADNETGWSAMLGPSRGTAGVPETASPARMQDATGLPPAFIEVGELDLFRDEAIDFARKYYKAGVSMELHVYPGCTHGFDLFSDESSKVAKRAFDLRDRAIIAIEPADVIS
ncbi:Alpha/Beta hydrolase protein [Dactylonectria macrodidyma]|uniref:Alpha/Beta hydrolase protein n=1 Tax=Dactylonectria macrodidyma TaxID=307937 RepID=A0A9P9FGT5_9HYPO|nr:Alpha/Beta hydrolase protein [Dactylonectria macrodidyma]